MGTRSVHDIGAALLVAVALGCSSSSGPGIQPEITNATDNFQYQVSAVDGYTGTLTYYWQHTGTVASVNQATTVTGGSMTLVIRDANNNQVYSQSLATNGTLDTSAGTAGQWKIVVTYTNASGTVNFRVQKKP